MVESYFLCNKNSELTISSYVEKYPDKRVNNYEIFQRLGTNLINFGSFRKTRQNRYSTFITE